MRLLLTAVAAILLLLCCAMGTSAQEWSNLRAMMWKWMPTPSPSTR
jgi:hypothetical protein